MVTISTLRRIAARSREFSVFIILALAGMLLMATASKSRATDFSIVGSNTVHFYSPGVGNITLHKNAGLGWLRVVPVKTGASSIRIDSTPFYFDPADSGSNYSFSITFTAHGRSIDTARITFTDSLSESHVLTVIAEDSAYRNITSDYRIYGSNLGQNYYEYASGYGSIELVDIDSADINVQVTLHSGTGWTLDTTTLLIHPYEYAQNYYGEFLPLRHTATRNGPDTAVVYLACTSPLIQHDTIYVISHDSLGTSTVQLSGNSISMGVVPLGDTSCNTFTLRNPSGTDVTITALYIHADNSSGFHLSNPPTVPFTLSAHDSAVYTVCFSGDTLGIYASARLYVDYNSVGSATTADAWYLSAWTPVCVSVMPDSVRFEDVIRGGWVEASFWIRNNSTSSETVSDSLIYRDSMSAPAFSFDPDPFPFTLAAGDSMLVHAKFAPTDSLAWHDETLEVKGNNACGPTLFGLIGGNVLDGTDTSAIALLPSQTEVLPMTGASTAFTKTFTFVNNASNSEKVDDISLTDNTHFHILSPTSFGMTLTTGESLSVEIECDADTMGFYRDTVVVVTEHGATSQRFILEAVRQALQSVTPSASLEQASLFLSPNPTNGPLTIDLRGATRANIQILDVLGREVASVKSSGHWIWPGVSNAGVYFVRASGIDLHGHSFTVTNRVVEEH